MKLDHLNLTVANLKETVDWYSRVFGFELVEEGVRDGVHWGVIRKDDALLCIYEQPDRVYPGNFGIAGEDDSIHRVYHFGLRIEDREKFEKVLKDQNVETYYGSPIRYPHSLSWYVKDPTGYSVEVALWDNATVSFA